MDKKKVKRQNILELGLLLILVILINLAGSFIFHRFDLTQEKRYSISEGTRKYLSDLKDVVYIKVYLEGKNLPSGFLRLSKATKELLSEFKVYGKENIEFEFINPSESPDEKTRREVYTQLAKDGLRYFNIQSQTSGGAAVQQAVFPSTLLSYRQHGQEYERVVNFFSGTLGNSFNDETINRAIETLEYEFISGIRTVSRENTPKVGFLEGHGELNQYESAGLARALTDFYLVERVQIAGRLNALDKFSALVIADPKERFSEQDKFIIDQYILRGGKVLWMVDAIKVDMNRIAIESETIGEVNSIINIGDMLFTYGARVNSSVIQDVQCAVLPVDTREEGADQPKWQLAPFVFFPLLAGRPDNPISRNINPVKFEFVSPVDTVGEDPELKKTIIMTSSGNSRIVRTPVRVSTSIFAEKPDPSRFPMKYLPVAVLLEGNFTSHFRNRLMPDLVNNDVFKVFEKSEKPSKMIVIADGEVGRNFVQVRDSQYYPYPLGYDQYTQTTFGNRDFLLNCVNYLLDDEGVMGLRSREVKVRLLDYDRITGDNLLWKLFNLILPVAIVILAGLVYLFIRKKKYSK
ncbi:MAG: gliding motility-associated ABC transporter substrate-binding protein GldG [Bacteroidota bacterium]